MFGFTAGLDISAGIRSTAVDFNQGYNGTVLAYGQTGSGKTHTMSGGVGIHGIPEEGMVRIHHL